MGSNGREELTVLLRTPMTPRAEAARELQAVRRLGAGQRMILESIFALCGLTTLARAAREGRK